VAGSPRHLATAVNASSAESACEPGNDALPTGLVCRSVWVESPYERGLYRFPLNDIVPR
jgi:hypothetical protein